MYQPKWVRDRAYGDHTWTTRPSSYLTGLVFNFTASFLSYVQFATIQRQPAAYPHQLFDEFDGPSATLP